MPQSVGKTRIYWLHALTPLHVGSGRGIGFIDLPVVREKVTSWPYVPGSSVKGVMADHYEATVEQREKSELLRLAFGQADRDGEPANAGALVFTDAHLVALPVRSLFGTFTWCTSPLVLRRLLRDIEPANLPTSLDAVEEPDGVETVLVPDDPKSALLSEKGKVFLEDLDFAAEESPRVKQWAAALANLVFPDDPTWQEQFQRRFAVLHNNVFDFLTETATQVDARVKIDNETKTVATGQLWYEESLPQETILAGQVWCGPVFGRGLRADGQKRDEIMALCQGSLQLQIGGKATVGRGRVNSVFTGS